MERKETVHKEKEDWFSSVDDRIKEMDYPLHRQAADEKLRDVNIEGEKASWYFDKMEWPIKDRDEFMERFRRARESR